MIDPNAASAPPVSPSLAVPAIAEAARRTLISRARLLAAVVLAVVLGLELAVLTVQFDVDVYSSSDYWWTQAMRATPVAMRLGLVLSAAAFLFSFGSVRAMDPAVWTDDRPIWCRWTFAALHVLLFAALYQQSTVVFSHDLDRRSWAAVSVAVWLTVGLLSLVTCGLSLGPSRMWFELARVASPALLPAAAVAAAAWILGWSADRLWVPLAGATLAVVDWLLSLVYDQTVLDAARRVVGTPRFAVTISPECSGYEGLGLMAAFLTVWLWVSRRRRRWPASLFLVPAGLAAVWMANAVRIAALVIVGHSWSPAVAEGGFHSQAGWLAFNFVALGLVAVAGRTSWFVRAESTAGPSSWPAAAYLVPFLAMQITGMVVLAIAPLGEARPPIGAVVAAVCVWQFRRRLNGLGWRVSWQALLTGFVVGIGWYYVPVESGGSASPSLPWMGLGPTALLSVVLRTVAYVGIVPLVEELAFRGFLLRRIQSPEFETVAFNHRNLLAVVVSSLAFGLMHGSFWLPGTIAGIVFALTMWRKGRFGEAFWAHLAANGTLAILSLVTNDLSIMS